MTLNYLPVESRMMSWPTRWVGLVSSDIMPSYYKSNSGSRRLYNNNTDYRQILVQFTIVYTTIPRKPLRT